MAFAAASALVSAESILALTPIAIKKTPVDPLSVLWSRILSSASIGWAVTSDTKLNHDEQVSAVALGGTNLLHIASSYESFRHLPAGQAMSLLYTFPLWNLVFGALFVGDRISARDYGLMAVATLGAVILNTDPAHAAMQKTPQGGDVNTPWGIAIGLLMAMTESGMHTLLHKMNWLDPAKAVWVVNSSAGAWLLVLVLLQSAIFGSSSLPAWRGAPSDFLWLTVFHGVTLFSGYWLRFYAIPRLSTVTFSILSYAGLIAAFVFGLLFLGERPGWMSVLGIALIIGSGALLQMSSDDTTKGK
jgi:drug/metabolite transporter (DMT)-like permease